MLAVLATAWLKLGAPPLLLAVIATRELILVPLAIIYRLSPRMQARIHYRFRVGRAGKATTVAQFVAITALLFEHPSAATLAVLAGLIGLGAAAIYVQRGVQLARAVHTRAGG